MEVSFKWDYQRDILSVQGNHLHLPKKDRLTYHLATTYRMF